MNWETAIKLGAALASMVTVLVTAWQFLITQRVAAATPFLERKLAWCEEALETAAALAIRLEPSERDLARFWELYWGVMVLIENAEIEDAMVDFGKELEKTQTFEGGAKDVETHLVGLRGKSVRLARACRSELASEWSVSWRRDPASSPETPTEASQEDDGGQEQPSTEEAEVRSFKQDLTQPGTNISSETP